MSNVVGLRGEDVITTPEPNPEVVEIAEKILDMARSGEIKGLFAFHVHVDDSVGCEQRGPVSYRMIGLITAELQSMCRDME